MDRTVEAVSLARELRYGVTGNFVIDPDWGESDFERLWGFVERHELGRAGLHDSDAAAGHGLLRGGAAADARASQWSQYDMHHVLWEPRLGVKRFFELYCETWRRSILNLRGHKSWRDWARQVRLRRSPAPDPDAAQDPADDAARGVPPRAPAGRAGRPHRHAGRQPDANGWRTRAGSGTSRRSPAR